MKFLHHGVTYPNAPRFEGSAIYCDQLLPLRHDWLGVCSFPFCLAVTQMEDLVEEKKIVSELFLSAGDHRPGDVITLLAFRY